MLMRIQNDEKCAGCDCDIVEFILRSSALSVMDKNFFEGTPDSILYSFLLFV
jgi:hypothetical protein